MPTSGVLERVESSQDPLHESEAKIACRPQNVSELPVRGLAKHPAFSRAAIIRPCHTLTIDGYRTIKVLLTAEFGRKACQRPTNIPKPTPKHGSRPGCQYWIPPNPLAEYGGAMGYEATSVPVPRVGTAPSVIVDSGKPGTPGRLSKTPRRRKLSNGHVELSHLADRRGRYRRMVPPRPTADISPIRQGGTR